LTADATIFRVCGGGKPFQKRRISVLKNMSIRNKLVVSNMLMVIVPVAIITAVILLTTLSITYFSTSKMSFDPSFGSYLLYKTQFNVSSLEDKIKTPKKSDTDRLGAMDKKRIAPLRAGITKSGSGMEDRISDAVLGACANIQRDGSDIMILANDEIIYKTVEADVYEMVGAVIDICGKSLSDINSPFVTSDDSGTVVTDVFSVEGEGIVKIIVVNKNLNAIVSPSIYSGSSGIPIKGNNIIAIAAVVAVVAIIITNGLLVILMLKSIMEPMTILQTATHELRDGNLDYKVPYSSKNEIGQVCADFEEMRQRLKESVEQQQKYEENRMQLIAGISHDLGTPLTTIKGYASGILDGIADTDEKKMRYVGVIYDTAQGMDTLVSELSMLSKLSLDKVPFYFEKIKAKDFFEEYTAYAADTLGEAGIEFIYNFECDEDREINIDPAQFRRVLNNLIDNSRKYGAEDGTAKIMLSVRNGENGHTEISIEDNGQGVPADERDKIFETFYRGDKARTGHKNGSGLGLAITKQITDRHGASIRADESELGGLKVIIDLPQAK
jgi:integral membrane sensor signal transduction histidine kinase